MSYEQRFMQRAAQNPAAFERAVRQKFGKSSAGVNTILRIASKLSQPGGNTMSQQDAFDLQDIGSGSAATARHLATVWAAVNAAAPDRRAEMFIGAVVGDPDAAFGNRAHASDGFKEVDDLVTKYTLEDYSARVNAKLGGSRASSAWQPERGGVRDLIEQQVTPRAQRELNEAFERGDPDAEADVREAVANVADDAITVLAAPDLSTRGALSAAYSYHEAEAFARDEFGIDPESNTDL